MKQERQFQFTTSKILILTSLVAVVVAPMAYLGADGFWISFGVAFVFVAILNFWILGEINASD